MKKQTIILVLCAVVWSACTNSNSQPYDGGRVATAETTPADTVKQDQQLILALLYQQRAAEYRALCLQCYRMAKQSIDATLANRASYTKKPFAVVTDLDETALDNSGNEAWLFLHDSAYAPDEFNDWSIHGHAGAVPGAVDFFSYVDRLRDLKGRKVHIYYVSNRTDTAAVVKGTIEQMNDLHFPKETLTGDHFRFQKTGTTSSKEPRRQAISIRDTIICLLGDNLIDLSSAFDNTAADSATRMRRVDSMAASWGQRYIVFPNAQYGDWEKALYPNGQYTKLGREQGFRIGDLLPIAH